jgi:hypothetical protein
MSDIEDLDARDRAALKRALKQVRTHGKDRAQQIDSRLADEPWDEVARFAAYSCQIHALKLRPWEDPSMYGDIVGAQDRAAKLLEKMLAAGISRWEPNPMQALAAAKRRKRRDD